MDINPYLTVKNPANTELVVERSRFIGHCLEASTEADAKSFIAQIKVAYAQASHNCYAYRVGNSEHPFEYYNDQGEPAGTAGKPILGAISRLGLTNTVVVVTRYFGGKKLGVRGLIEAYGQAATQTLEAAGQVLRVPRFGARLIYGYAEHSLILHRLQQVEAEVVETTFMETIATTITVPEGKRGAFLELLRELPVAEWREEGDGG